MRIIPLIILLCFSFFCDIQASQKSIYADNPEFKKLKSHILTAYYVIANLVVRCADGEEGYFEYEDLKNGEVKGYKEQILRNALYVSDDIAIQNLNTVMEKIIKSHYSTYEAHPFIVAYKYGFESKRDGSTQAMLCARHENPLIHNPNIIAFFVDQFKNTSTMQLNENIQNVFFQILQSQNSLIDTHKISHRFITYDDVLDLFKNTHNESLKNRLNDLIGFNIHSKYDFDILPIPENWHVKGLIEELKKTHLDKRLDTQNGLRPSRVKALIKPSLLKKADLNDRHLGETIYPLILCGKQDPRGIWDYPEEENTHTFLSDVFSGNETWDEALSVVPHILRIVLEKDGIINKDETHADILKKLAVAFPQYGHVYGKAFGKLVLPTYEDVKNLIAYINEIIKDEEPHFQEGVKNQIVDIILHKSTDENTPPAQLKYIENEAQKIYTTHNLALDAKIQGIKSAILARNGESSLVDPNDMRHLNLGLAYAKRFNLLIEGIKEDSLWNNLFIYTELDGGYERARQAIIDLCVWMQHQKHKEQDKTIYENAYKFFKFYYTLQKLLPAGWSLLEDAVWADV